MLPTDIMVTSKEISLAIMYKSIAFLNEQLVQSAAVNWDSNKKKKNQTGAVTLSLAKMSYPSNLSFKHPVKLKLGDLLIPFYVSKI